MTIPTLSELCARKLLESTDISAEEKLAILEGLKRVSQTRCEKLEQDFQSLSNTAAKKRPSPSPKEKNLWTLDHESSQGSPQKHNRKETKSSLESKSLESLDDGQNLSDEDEVFEREQAIKYQKAAEEAKRRRKALKQVFEWKQKFTQLNHRSQMLERELQAMFRVAKAESDTVELERLDAELERKRNVERRDIFNHLDKSRWAVQRLAATIAEMGTGEAYIKNIKSQVQDTEASISAFKAQQRKAFEELLKKEENLTLQVDQLKDKLDQEEQEMKAWKRAEQREVRKARKQQQSSYAVSPRGRSPRAVGAEISEQKSGEVSSSSTLKARIEEIDDEIAEMGGATGLWDSRDHSAFLRCVSRLRIPDVIFIRNCESPNQEVAEGGLMLQKLISRALLEIPTVDEKGVNDHIFWYGKYLSLLEEKKSVVQEWKASKQRGAKVSDSKEQSDPNTSATHKKVSKAERLKLEQQRREEEQARRKSITEWKAAKRAERERERRAKEEEERVERELRTRQALERRKERERIALFKLEREAEKERQKQLQETLDKEKRVSEKVNSSLTLKERQKRDLELANHRRSLLEEKTKEREARADHIAKLKAKPALRPEFAEKLRHRHGAAALTEPTTAFKRKSLTPEELGEIQERRARTRAHESAVPSAAGASFGGRSYGIGVKNIVSGRAMPSWKAS